jgi:hypothetical protein
MPTPKCHEFDEQLQTAVETRTALDLSAPEWVGWAEHVRRCVDCSKQWREAVTLQTALASWATRLTDADRVDAHFADAVMARWNTESTTPVVASAESSSVAPAADGSRASRSSWTRANALVVALVLCVVAALGFLLPPRLGQRVAGPGNADPGREIASPESKGPTKNASESPIVVAENTAGGTNSPSRDNEGLSSDDDMELTGLLRNAGTASLSLAGEAAGVMREAASLVTVARTSPDSMIDAPVESPAADLPTKALIPWSQKLESAVDFLWDALPLDESPAT